MATTSIMLTQQYPEDKFNLLGNTSVMTTIPDLMTPVIQVVSISPDPAKGEVYIQQKASEEWYDRSGRKHPGTGEKYAITKNGLKKLADGAGIKMVRSEHVLPNTCQKCVAANQSLGKPVPCGTCQNKDIAFKVTISVPQLTGESITVEDTNEIVFSNLSFNSEKERAQFLKFMPQICEAKALNGAIRTALHLKGTYTLQELQKPFVVAYLVPNLENAEVKEAAIRSMFASTSNLYGTKAPTVEHIEAKAPNVPQIEMSENDQDVIDQYVNEPAQEDPRAIPQNMQPAPVQQQPQAQYQALSQQGQPSPSQAYHCSQCGHEIAEKVYNYSMQKFNRPLCYQCQDTIRRGNK